MNDSKPVVLITGGTDGLGRAAAVLLAQEGYRVFAAGRSAERRAEVDLLARERRLPLETLEMDVTDDASVERGVAEVRGRGGPIEVLITSAGLGYLAVMEEIRMEDLKRQFEVNFFGTVRTIQRVLPEMRERRRGRIINMSSAAGRIVPPLYGPYSGSKYALEAMSDALRLELLDFGVHIVLIEPGYIPTGFQPVARELSSAYTAPGRATPYAKIYEAYRTFWRRPDRPARTTPEDCARLILRAVRDARPRTRYTICREAKLAPWLKRLLPDRTVDRILLRMFGLGR